MIKLAAVPNILYPPRMKLPVPHSVIVVDAGIMVYVVGMGSDKLVNLKASSNANIVSNFTENMKWLNQCILVCY